MNAQIEPDAVCTFCAHPFDEHDGPAFECGDLGCVCIEFVEVD